MAGIRTVLLVRHAERRDFQIGAEAWKEEARAIGVPVVDTPLSDAGRVQAAETAAALSSLGVRRVLSSPFQRCLHTAQAIAEAADCAIGVELGLCELPWGGSHADVPPAAERVTQFGRVDPKYRSVVDPAAGEDLLGCLQRYASVAQKVADSVADGSSVCCVTHAGGVVSMAASLLRCRHRDLPPAPAACIWRLCREGEGPWVLAAVEGGNESATAHLSAASSTRPWPLRVGDFGGADRFLAGGDEPPWATGADRRMDWYPHVGGGRLRVVTWNVLAHIHTHHNSEGHGGGRRRTESTAQMSERHARVTAALRRLRPDAALLQEVDFNLLPAAPDGFAADPHGFAGYDCYMSYSGRGEGTVVLLRRSVFEDASAVRVPSSSETGGKTAVTVRARLRSTGGRVQLSSVHLPWGKPAEQLALLRKSCVADCGDAATILAGDFNVRPGRQLQPLTEQLASAGLSRLPTPDGVGTGLQGDLSYSSAHVIDHLYASKSFRPLPDTDATGRGQATVGDLPPTGRQGPWGGPEKHDGSDHAWLLFEFELPRP